MKTAIRVLIILLAALAVTGATYALSQNAWLSQQLASAPGERGESRAFDLRANLAGAAQTLGVSVEELQAALGGMPPDYASAAQQLGLAEDDVRAAVETSLAALGEHREGGLSGGFNAVTLATFGRILLPMALMIGGVALVRAVVERGRRRRVQSI
ncbi:MAG TPA: hypothetical protein DCL15_02250 [Chloroflexi bacterium]|nr:hypothetical protein [Chloroflexota bacterium]HHW86415.1 hypothetical protein [Chloroflexota bacterium]